MNFSCSFLGLCSACIIPIRARTEANGYCVAFEKEVGRFIPRANDN